MWDRMVWFWVAVAAGWTWMSVRELGLKIEEGIGLQVESRKRDGNRGVLVWFESE